MTEAIFDIQAGDNPQAVRLPAALIEAAHLRMDRPVRITVEQGRIIITPWPNADLSLEARLARFDPQRHGGEVLTVEPIGAEQW